MIKFLIFTLISVKQNVLAITSIGETFSKDLFKIFKLKILPIDKKLTCF